MKEIPTGDSVLEYIDYIEDMFSSIPDKRTKDYKTWKETINKAIQIANKKVGGKIYNLV